jgi:hypothetical protein
MRERPAIASLRTFTTGHDGNPLRAAKQGGLIIQVEGLRAVRLPEKAAAIG